MSQIICHTLPISLLLVRHGHLPSIYLLNCSRAGLMCYFIFWLIQFPLMLISPQKVRHFFTVKSIIVPAAWLAVLIWAMVKVPAKISLAPNGPSLSGSALSWAWLSSLNSALGFYATLSINIPDFTVCCMFLLNITMTHILAQRYAKNERVYAL